MATKYYQVYCNTQGNTSSDEIPSRFSPRRGECKCGAMRLWKGFDDFFSLLPFSLCLARLVRRKSARKNGMDVLLMPCVTCYTAKLTTINTIDMNSSNTRGHLFILFILFIWGSIRSCTTAVSVVPFRSRKIFRNKRTLAA